MSIRTINGVWGVFTEWLGEERVVFRGSIWDCISYRAAQAPLKVRTEWTTENPAGSPTTRSLRGER